MKILIASSVYNAVCRNLVSMVLEWPIYRRILKITEHLNPDCTPIKSLKKKLSSSVILRFKFFLLVKFWQYRHVWWQLKKQGCIWSCYAVKWTTKAVTYFKTSSKHEIRHRYPIINNCYTYIHTRTYNTYRQYIQTHLSFHSVRQLLFLSCGGLCLVRRFWRRRRYVGNDGAMTSAPTSFRSVFWRYTHFHENLNRNSSLLHACMYVWKRRFMWRCDSSFPSLPLQYARGEFMCACVCVCMWLRRIGNCTQVSMRCSTDITAATATNTNSNVTGLHV